MRRDPLIRRVGAFDSYLELTVTGQALNAALDPAEADEAV
jgi:hypothetical protein